MGNFLKTIFFISACFSLSTLTVQGQSSFNNDTIDIEEVIITRKQISSIRPGFRIASIDSGVLKNYSLFSIADILNETSPLFMKSYGLGGTATPSFRGTSAGHTLIMWNGININNQMLGQSDFSILPAGMIDNVKISFGGASMDLGDGAIGAIINLETEPLWERQTVVDLNPGIGSFGRYSGLVKVQSGTENFQTVTKAYLHSAQNNFPFLNPETGSETAMMKREKNETFQKGFLQEFYLRKSSNVLSARFWYQAAARNLPGSLPADNDDEKQDDESFRALLNYDVVKEKSEYFISTAWMTSKLNYDYISELYPYISRNRINTFVLKGGLTTSLGKYTRLKMIINEEISAITTNNYATGVKRNLASFTLSAERRKGERLGTVILLRETSDGTSLLIPDFSAGLDYRIIKGTEHFLKLNVSRNSKIPSLNDCYWNPGGNPDLKNEYAFSSELGYNFSQKISGAVTINSDINLFTNYIRDMIQWRPTETSMWMADNIGSVNSSGLEFSLSGKYQMKDVLIDLKTAYTYNKAVEKTLSDETSPKQLVYIPENQANCLLQLGYKNLYSAWVIDFTGATYITADNSGSLPGYTVNNLMTGFKINLTDNFIDLRFKVENLFNVSYQTIAYYPQPGRSYFLSLLFRFTK